MKGDIYTTDINLIDEYKNLLKANVTAGAKLLDKKFPEWRTSINVNSFDMNLCGYCVLGQLRIRPRDNNTGKGCTLYLIDDSKISVRNKNISDLGFIIDETLTEFNDCLNNTSAGIFDLLEEAYRYLTFLWLEELGAPI